jgi:ethanolamine ammonia-lyase small subunit
LYCHGNKDHMDFYWPRQKLYAHAGGLGHYGVLMFDYPSFGLSEGKASEANMYRTTARAIEWLQAQGAKVLMAHSAAASRDTYLRRPDLGRTLDADSRARLAQTGRGSPDLAIIVADGLSAAAVHRQARGFLEAFLPVAEKCGWRVAPLVIARQARVAIGDEIADLMGARAVLVLIGERPGLSSPDSLGAYLTLNRPGPKTDADRNCVSNIRPEGLEPQVAADKVARLLAAAFDRGLTGVGLKDEDEPLALPSPSVETL